MNSCSFFLSEIEEMKSCIYRVETANAGMGLQWVWHHLFILLLEETVLFATKRICKIHYLTRVCNHYPMLTVHFAGLRVYNGKSVIVKSWIIVRGKTATVPILEIRLIICWGETLSTLDVFSNNTKLVNCN